MPRVVPCYRTRKDHTGKTIVEKLMMWEPGANEAVKNGKGEWSRQEPKGGVAVTELESKAMPVESETRRAEARRNG